MDGSCWWPDDWLCIFVFCPLRCLKFMGSRHPTLVLPLVSELLSTHPYFDTPEPDMDDPACILHSPEKCSNTLTSHINLILQPSLSVCWRGHFLLSLVVFSWLWSSDIAVLVLVFNAAKSCPTMPALFSDHTFRHYAYLRDSLSHLVPPLRVRTQLL